MTSMPTGSLRTTLKVQMFINTIRVNGLTCMSCSIESTMVFLYSNPPSSRRALDRKVIRLRCLEGNLRHSELEGITDKKESKQGNG